MVRQLAGEEVPPLPDAPGRRCGGWPDSDGRDPVRERWNLDHQLLDGGDGDALD